MVLLNATEVIPLLSFQTPPSPALAHYVLLAKANLSEVGGYKICLLLQVVNMPQQLAPPLASAMLGTGQEEDHLGQMATPLAFC